MAIAVEQTTQTLPTYTDVEAAAGRIAGFAVETPLIESPELNARTGGRVLIKSETLQRTGSFKFRGAFNRISQIPASDRARGVLAYSSGNHAQGVAAACAILDIPATIVMPADAPQAKLDNTRAYGAKVVIYDRYRDVREDIAAALLQESGATLVRPYDDPGIIAGQGTCGRELAQQAVAVDAKLDVVLICCGGGGLSAGCALALDALSPETAVYAIEPEGFDDTGRSLRSGRRESNAGDARSICDALLAKAPGELTFAINRRLLAGGLAVSDDEARFAMAYAFRRLKMVVEPGGAVCLAALLAGKLTARDQTIALTFSGGNVDPARMAEALDAYPDPR